MRNPAVDILLEYAPISVWRESEKQALRSTLKQFRTGCCIFDKHGKIISKGCSHYSYGVPPRPNVHSEQHALMNIRSCNSMSCLIVTLNRNGNYASCSKPCAFCTHLLHKAGIEHVIYAERTDGGKWIVNKELISDLIKRVDYDMIHETYTREMRIT